MKSVFALGFLALAGNVLAAPALGEPAHVDTPLIPLDHEHVAAPAAEASIAARDANTVMWSVLPDASVYALRDVPMQMAAAHQVHHAGNGGLMKRKKSGIVCSRGDLSTSSYGETWAAYKLAAVLGSLASTNSSAVVAIDGGHGHCVDLTACDEHERARIQLCNDNDKPISIHVKTIAEYTYAIIYECAKQDGSGLIWGQQFDSKSYNVIVSACPVASKKRDEKDHKDHDKDN